MARVLHIREYSLKLYKFSSQPARTLVKTFHSEFLTFVNSLGLDNVYLYMCYAKVQIIAQWFLIITYELSNQREKRGLNPKPIMIKETLAYI